MRRWIAALAALTVMLMNVAVAESVMAELRSMRKTAGDRIQQMEAPPTPAPESTPAPTPDIHYAPLEQGMKGDAVAALQTRLIALGFLNGKADGSFGGKTAEAVKAFQQAAALERTGVADDETQRRLFWGEVPVQNALQKLDYAAAMNDPAAYAGAQVQFSGSVLQILEDDTDADTRGIYTVMRVATRGEYDNVAYVAWFRPASVEPFAEGDGVTVRGVARGIYEYANEAGDILTLPRIEADSVER